MEPDSLRSASCGILEGLDSRALESCDRAITGISSSQIGRAHV